MPEFGVMPTCFPPCSMVWKWSALSHFCDRSLHSRPHTGQTPFSVSGVPTRPFPLHPERAVVRFQVTSFAKRYCRFPLVFICSYPCKVSLPLYRYAVMHLFDCFLPAPLAYPSGSIHRCQARGQTSSTLPTHYLHRLQVRFPTLIVRYAPDLLRLRREYIQGHLF